MSTKKLHINPVWDGAFEIVDLQSGKRMTCGNADKVGELMEAATWPLIKPGLEARKAIKITIEYE